MMVVSSISYHSMQLAKSRETVTPRIVGDTKLMQHLQQETPQCDENQVFNDSTKY